MQATYLTPDQVPEHLRAGYTGAKFKASVAESVTIPLDAGLWSDGSRDLYHVVRLADGAEIDPFKQHLSPWARVGGKDQPVTLQPGFAVVLHSWFRGTDTGLTFYVHPSDAAKLLPAPAPDLTATDANVLDIVGGIISRYRPDEARRRGISAADYAAALERLKGLGLLTKQGGITPAGRNAAARR